MGELPLGTVTFVFTDIEGSTRLVQRLGRRFKDLLERHQRLIRDAVDANNGVEVRSIGDGLFLAFERATDALHAAVQAQRALCAADWPDDAVIRVRMGMHTGEAIFAAGDYVGYAVHEAARVSAAGHGGQILLTEATAALARGDVPDGAALVDLGLHRLKDLAEPLRLYEVHHADLPETFPPLRSLSVQPNNLPLQLTSFVGRDAEVSELAKLIPAIRLLTLAGMGGTGKTRLAIEAAGDLLGTFPDGAWFVDLAGIADPSAVPRAILSAVNAREAPGREPLASAVDAITDGSMLLILDNCEHVLDAAATAADTLIRGCPALRIVATSREPLGMDGETVRHIPPLGVPAPDAAVEQIVAADAVRLFLDRAFSSAPSFRLTDAGARAIARICARVDGIPLAIELAAARARVLSPEQIDKRLDDVFSVLGKGSRIARPRQQTLRAAIRWSDDLLSQSERTLFHRLSVFDGSFSLEAAEGICASPDVPVEQIVDLLAALTEKSLVAAEAGPGARRYRLLQIVRQYAAERLVEEDPAEQIRGTHARWFADLVQPLSLDAGRPEMLDAIEADLDNLRGALAWGIGPGDVDTGVRLVDALATFWMFRGYLAEGWGWARAYLDRVDPAPAGLLQAAGNLAQRRGEIAQARDLHARALDRSRAEGNPFDEMAALTALGSAAHGQGEYQAARAHYEQALAIARAGDRKGAVAALLGNLGHIAHAARDYAGALKLYEESLALARMVGNDRSTAEALQSYGRTLADVLRNEEAVEAYREAIEIARRLGDKQLIAVLTSSRGNLSLAQGRIAEARRAHEEALEIRREIGDLFGQAISGYHLAETLSWAGEDAEARDLLAGSLETFEPVGAALPAGVCLSLLGAIDTRAGRLEDARRHLRRALELFAPLGDPLALCTVFEAVADMLIRGEDHDDAVALLAASASLRDEYEMPHSVPSGRDADRKTDAARSRLGEEAFGRAWAFGASLALEEMVERAMRATAAT